jgi:transglutaminase-like putative cysteine protease
VRYRVVHRTEYEYGSPVAESFSEAWMLPRELPIQHCEDRRLRILPVPATYGEHDDFFGNRVAAFTHHTPHRRLVVEAESVVDTQPAAPPDLLARASWESVRQRLHHDPDPECLLARQFVLDSPLVPITAALRDYATVSFPAGRPLVEAVRDLSSRIHRDFTYESGVTTLTTRANEALDRRVGVCQDFSQVFLGGVRALGLAGRYVSGYLETHPPDGQEKLVGSDASHAWVSVFVPGRGWFDLDPTNDVLPGEGHITTAWGRDYTDVTPLKGVLFSDGGEHELTVAVDVTPVG